MGCGKTTIGSAVATELGVPFTDLDDYIEERCQARIGEIFTQMGEARFRKIEQQALAEVAHGSQGAVVACGGGTPCYGRNMSLMNSWGLTIWLRTSAERIASRLCLPEHKMKRPLIAGKSDEEIYTFVKEELAKREPFYAQAQLQFDSTRIETASETLVTARQLAALLAQA